MAGEKGVNVRAADGVVLRKPSTFQQYKTLLRKDLEQEFRTK